MYVCLCMYECMVVCMAVSGCRYLWLFLYLCMVVSMNICTYVLTFMCCVVFLLQAIAINKYHHNHHHSPHPHYSDHSSYL